MLNQRCVWGERLQEHSSGLLNTNYHPLCEPFSPSVQGKTSTKTMMKAASSESPQPPVIGKVTHHSIELIWVHEDSKPRTGSPEHWTRYSVEHTDPKTQTYDTIFIGYSTHYVVEELEPNTSYSFRLRVTRPSGESHLSPTVSVFTTREPYSGKNLHQAVNREDEKELTNVLQSGTVDVNVRDQMGYTPLMVAAQKGFMSLVDVLVKDGADIKMKDSTGKDSLMMACYAGHLDIVKYLRKCGTTWESRDKNGCSPLHWAVDGGHLPVITYMILDGCEVDIRDKVFLWTPLMRVAIISGSAAVAAVLLKAGADANVRDKAGKTPLMAAVLNNYEDLVKLLLGNGADHHMKNKHGADAADMATAFGGKNIIKLLDKISLEN